MFCPVFFKDSTISGFRASHWLSGSCTQDYGSVTIMPITGTLKTVADDYKTKFKHEDEISEPNYYKVFLPAYNVKVEITATKRCGYFRISTNNEDSLYLLVTPNSDYGKGYIKYDSLHNQIIGYNPVHRIYQGWGKPAGFNGYFVIQLNSKVYNRGVYSNNVIWNLDSIKEMQNIGVFLKLKTTKLQDIEFKIGTSFTSISAARNNLAFEIGNRNFESIRANGKNYGMRHCQKLK